MHKYILSFIALILFSACANQTAPTGGPKDETPPILLGSEPAQGQLHFDGKEIILTFDELVRTENPKEQFIITPRIADEYEIIYRKDEVRIKFEKPLQDSTTYSINFREGIKDVTEGNAADTLRLAFSTGNYLDSISLSGTVEGLLNNKPLKDVTVSLYQADDTLDLLNSPPLYLTETTEDGTYSLRNVKNGSYRIYALADKNKNMTLESKSEAYAFEANTLHLDSNLTNLNLAIQLLDIRDLTLQSARQSGTTYIVKFNKYITDYTLEPYDTLLDIYSNFENIDHNTVQIFRPENLIDSSAVVITATDSINSIVKDTIMLKFEPTQRKPGDFTVEASVKNIIIDKPLFETTLTFSKPVTHVNFDSLYVYLDSTHIIPFTKDKLIWNKRRDELQLQAALDPDLFVTDKETTEATTIPPAEKNTIDSTQVTQDRDTIPEEPPKETPPPPKPHFYASPNTFISVESDSSQRIQKNLVFMRPDQLSIIIIHVQTEEEHYFVQLLNSRNEVVDEVRDGKEFKFTNVNPGEYRVRILVDANNNGKWDPGNLKENEEPEPVYFYKGSEGNEVISPRANWVMGPNVIQF